MVDLRLRVDDRDLAAINRALAAGIRVVACTGRPYPGAMPWVRKLGLTDPLVCYQGAQVRTVEGATLLDRGLPREVASEVVVFCRERDLHVQAYRDDRLLVERDRPEAHSYANHAGMPIDLVPDLTLAMGPTTPKVVIVAAPPVVEAILPEIRRRWRDRALAATSLPSFLEMTNPDADKGRALDFLAARLGVPPEAAMAIGDGRNDRAMLEWAGYPVAVEGAPQELLEVARRVIPGPGKGGIARLIAELLE